MLPTIITSYVELIINIKKIRMFFFSIKKVVEVISYNISQDTTLYFGNLICDLVLIIIVELKTITRVMIFWHSYMSIYSFDTLLCVKSKKKNIL